MGRCDEKTMVSHCTDGEAISINDTFCSGG